jgi:hypothetical protein
MATSDRSSTGQAPTSVANVWPRRSVMVWVSTRWRLIGVRWVR